MTFTPIFHCKINDFQTICQTGIRQDNTNYIHCGRKQLIEIPNFTRITNTFYDELVLNDNQIVEIHSNAFQGLRVKRLNLSGNKIRFISSQAFIELSNYLEELIIEFDSNYIHEIPNAIKTNLINLRSLKLINLNLIEIKNRTFIKYRKLEQLSIIKSQIKSIESDGLISLINLRYLNLEQNLLNDSSWNSLIKYLPNLEMLYLSQNNFNYLKKIHLTYLKILDLSSNGLQYIDRNIFQSLEKLYLQNNEINSLQLTFLLSLKNLKELNLDFNRLTFLPEKIFQTNSNLIYLSLQGNDLNHLTNYSFYGLNNLIHLNLARNRLQFLFNQQPFQYLNSLKILNLDRNLHMNIRKNILKNLSQNLIELSLQNCNLTKINFSLNFLFNLQRLKLSSNSLKELPKNFLNYSIISIDLQRNLFTSIPNLFENNSSNLIDLDLSSNQISYLNPYDLLKYPNLKIIGLTANPLDCNCHLQWIKQWLKENYEQDLIKFLQWTCAKPKHLFGKQLTIINEHDMICDENENIKQETTTTTTTTTESTLIRILSSTFVPLTSIKTNSIHTSTIESSLNELIIKDIIFNSNGILIISWEYMLSQLPKYYHIQIYDKNHHHMIYQRLIDGRQQSIEINMSDYIEQSSSIYIICINIEHKKYCRNIFLKKSNNNLIKSASLILSSNQQDNEQFIYLVGGILVGAILVCSILIIICYYRLHYYSKENRSKISSINCDENKSLTTFYYHPLNIISYPQQQSSNTSECSLHSSIDTNHLTNDPYHIYQQIPSVHNCQLHAKRTHILI
ncbi:unnamed protein product [Rotaria sp. Silwood1]|nr:unnamed protein product [Rotaria sp. Silwood1]CAF3381580.1 unnamed protein product [Rotaria sp. Silwood1]CAF4511632.1 unnamed protein product [Rotaria sp. Silwood1]